jgi:hypothetical protein
MALITKERLANPAVRARQRIALESTRGVRRTGKTELPNWAKAENAQRRMEATNRRSLAALKRDGDVTDREILQHVRKSLPTQLAREARDDISQEILLAIHAGKFLPWDIEARASEFVAAYYRQHPGKYGPLSLDAPIAESGTATLGDRIASDAFHF